MDWRVVLGVAAACMLCGIWVLTDVRINHVHMHRRPGGPAAHAQLRLQPVRDRAGAGAGTAPPHATRSAPAGASTRHPLTVAHGAATVSPELGAGHLATDARPTDAGCLALPGRYGSRFLQLNFIDEQVRACCHAARSRPSRALDQDPRRQSQSRHHSMHACMCAPCATCVCACP